MRRILGREGQGSTWWSTELVGCIRPRVATICVVVLLVFGGRTPDANAQWAGEGLRLDALGSWQPSAVCSDGQAGAIAVWPGIGGTGPTNLRAQSVDGRGLIRWVAGGVGLTPRLGLQENPAVAGDNAGGAYVVWEEKRYNLKSIYAQRVLASGLVAPGWPDTGLLVSTRSSSIDNLAPVVVLDGSGGCYCVWYQIGQGITTHVWTVFAQRINPDATRPVGWIDGGQIVAFGPGDNGRPAAVGDGSGGVYVTWIDYRSEGTSSAVYLQRFNADGTAPWGSPRDAALAVGKKEWVQIVSDGSGGTVVGWLDYRDIPGPGMYVKRMTANGVASPGWDPGGYFLDIAPYPNGPSAMVPDGAAGAIVAVAGGNYIRASRVAGNLSTIWVNRVLSSSTPQKEPPRAVPDGLGGAVVIWEDFGLGSKTIHAQRVTAAGAIAAGWPANGTDNVTNDFDGIGMTALPAVTAAEPSQTIVVYPGAQNSTMMAKIGADGVTVPVLVSLAEVVATPTQVNVRWFVTHDGPTTFRILRVEAADPSGNWELLGDAQEDGAGYVAFTDAAVRSGSRYGYRLAIRDGTEEVMSEPTWVDVPAELAFGLDGFAPNPADRSPIIAYTLAESGPATLEVIDVTGRRLWRFDVGQEGVGRHAVTIRALPAGVYVMRLSQGEVVQTVKGVIRR